MFAALAGEADVRASVAGLEDQLSIAAINGPSECVVSGAAGAGAEVERRLTGRGFRTRTLRTSHAFHSPLVEPALAGIEARAANLRFGALRIPFVSTLTGGRVEGELADPAYWGRQARRPVRFSDGIGALSSMGVDAFVEIGPGAVLAALGRRSGVASDALWVPSLREGRPDVETILGALGALWVRGVEHTRPGERRPPIGSLPTHPFERERCWPEAASRRSRAAAHPLLPDRSRLATGAVCFEGEFRASSPALLADHRVYGTVVVPGSAHVSMVLSAASSLPGAGSTALEDVAFLQALVLAEGEARTVQLLLEPSGEGRFEYRLFSRRSGTEESWTLHSRGRAVRAPAVRPIPPSPEALRGRLLRGHHVFAEFSAEARAGWAVELGPAFEWTEEVWIGEGEALARYRAPRPGEAAGFVLHPGLLDSFFTVLVVHRFDRYGESAWVPVALERFVVHGPVEGTLHAYGRLRPDASSETFGGDISIFDSGGRMVAEAKGLTLQRAPRSALLRALSPARPGILHVGAWRPAAAGGSAPGGGEWLVVGDRVGLARRLGRATALPAFREGTWEGIVHAAALEPGIAAREVLGSALALVQALQARQGPLPRLAFVTRGAVAVRAGDAPDPDQACLRGFVRSLPLEDPRFAPVAVDLDPERPLEEGLADLVAELLGPRGEDQVAFRGGARFVARWAPLAPPEAHPLPVRPDRTYVVVGGTGGLGRALVRRLERDGAGRVVALGRSSCDVGDESAVRAALAGLDPPLAGVFHLAGVLEDAPLAEQDEGRFDRVLRAKLDGAWNLHRATEDLPLDFFVLFSSAASVLGTRGQGAYGAANAGLGALAPLRRSRGLPALAVDWGPWEAAGMAEGAAGSRAWPSLGIGRLDPEEALDALGVLLDAGSVQAAAIAIDWPEFLAAFPAGGAPPLFAEVPRERLPARGRPAADPELRRRLEAAPAHSRRGILLSELGSILRRTMGTTGDRAIDPRTPLPELGLDSIQAVEVRDSLEASLGRNLPATLLFNYPTLEALAAHLDQDLFGAAAPEGQADELESLSEDRIAELLAEKLDQGAGA